MDQEYDHLFKVLVIGDSAVGKTSVLLRYVDDKFNPEFQTTIGVDFKVNTFSYEGKTIKLQLWDTAGQDRFRNIVASYYRGAQGIVFMYDITNILSFQNISKWNQEAQGYLQSSIPKILVGNKADLNSSRQVKIGDAQGLADRLGMEYIQTSAKNATNVRQAFQTMTRCMLDRLVTLPTAPTSTRITEGVSIKRGCCN